MKRILFPESLYFFAFQLLNAGLTTGEGRSIIALALRQQDYVDFVDFPALGAKKATSPHFYGAEADQTAGWHPGPQIARKFAAWGKGWRRLHQSVSCVLRSDVECLISICRGLAMAAPRGISEGS